MAHPNYRTIEKWLESQGIREMIDESLPDGISTDAWINSALTHIGSDKDLLEADPQSTLGSILEASTLGVRFEGPLGEAYLEARSSKYKADDGTWQWRKLTQLQIQYRGLMKLARRDPLVRKVEAIIVHENDVFDHRLGSDPYLNHTWDVRKQRGKMVAVYAALRYHDGFYDFGQPYPMSAIYKHRDRILSDKNIRVERRDDGSEVFWKTWKEGKPEEAMADFQIRRIPWITYIEAMAQKTAVRWSAKFWDLSPEFDKAAALVSLAESSKGQSMVDVARNVVGSEVLDGPDSPSGGATDDAQVQGRSILRMGTLKERMLAETGVQVDDAPSENEQRVELDESELARKDADDQAQGGELSEKDKEEALALEQEEAREFARQQEEQVKQGGKSKKKNPSKNTGRGRSNN